LFGFSNVKNSKKERISIILPSLSLSSSRESSKVRGDEKVIRIVESEIKKEGYDNFELNSITSLDKPNITFVIVNVGFMEISLEVDNITGKIINKEKLAR
jgi:hypothetical protein